MTKEKAKAKSKSEEKNSKPPASLPTHKTLGDIPTHKVSQSEDAVFAPVDLKNIREYLIQKTAYFDKLSSSLLNLELKSTGKTFLSSCLIDEGKEKSEKQLIPVDEQELRKRLDIYIERISNLLSVFNLTSDNSFELVWRCCRHMYSSYLILQSVATISSSSLFILTALDQSIIQCAFQLLGYFHGKRLISGQELNKFHSYRTDKSTITKRQKHEHNKGRVKTSAIKIFNQFTLSTIKNNISEAAFVNMIKDDLSPLKISETTIKKLLHELQDEGQINFDPRKTKSGKILHFANNGKDVT